MKKISLLFCGICLLTLASQSEAQIALTEIPINIPDYTLGFYDWADFDNDGDPDLVIYGKSGATYSSKIYLNQGNYSFSESPIPLPPGGSGEVRWGDYNNDNKQDLLFSADNGGLPGNFSRIYKNSNNQSFTDIQIPLPTNQSNEGSGLSSIWSDLNNDGLLDVITKGYISPCNYFFRVFRNNGGDSFTEAFSFTGTDNGRIVSGDVDNDGLKDIAFQGFSFCNNPQGLTRILKNEGNFNFTDLNSGLPGVLGIPNFVDFNNDGKLDIFVCGRVSGGQTAKLFINNLPTGYTESPIQFPVGEYFTEWHDFDSDGFKDVFFSVDTVFKIFHNDGGTGITEVTHNISVSGMPKILDINGDGKKELFINQGTGSKLYSFQSQSTNCPTFPASLTQGLVGYWPFCGNALDESGNGNHGTVNGATLTTDRFGNQGSAFEFDGQISHIKVSDDSSFEGNSLAVSIWVKAQKYCRDDKIRSDLMMKGIPSPFNYQWVTQLEQDGKIRVQCVTSSENILDTQDSISKNEWHNVVRNWNGSILSVYIDGVLKGSTNTSGNLVQGNGDLIFGGMAADQFFNGSLDDIAIWNRALTPQEIKQVYNQGICQTSITVTDTLLIHTGITSYNPVAYGNTVKVWPNPGNQDITLDAGNLSSMQGWKYKVANTLGQTVVNETAISQQQTMIDLSNWGGNGIYYLHLINPQGHAIEIKKIVLAP